MVVACSEVNNYFVKLGNPNISILSTVLICSQFIRFKLIKIADLSYEPFLKLIPKDFAGIFYFASENIQKLKIRQDITQKCSIVYTEALVPR